MAHGKPIIVITQARSGSNLLLEYLKQFPDVIALNEIFRTVRPPAVDTVLRNIDIVERRLDKLAELQRTDRLLFWLSLQRTLAAHDLRPAAKIFYRHVPREERLWTAFGKAKILHLVRENILAAIVSREFANRSNLWQSKTYRSDYDANPVIVTRKKCEKYIADLEADVEWVREKYRAADYCEIRFEDIADIATAQTVLANAFETTVVLREPRFVRQRRRPLNEVVANYAEVAAFDRRFPLVRGTH
jgi:LPS sulfotransferase NodH